MGAYWSLCGYTAASQNLVGVPMEDLDFNSRLTLAFFFFFAPTCLCFPYRCSFSVRQLCLPRGLFLSPLKTLTCIYLHTQERSCPALAFSQQRDAALLL